MKCYEINDLGFLTPGFLVRSGGRDPSVNLALASYIENPSSGPTELLFCEELRTRHYAAADGGTFLAPTRILRCNIEKRADFWLLPETEETKNQALVLCNGLLPKRKKPSRVVYDGPLSTTLVDSEVSNFNKTWNGKIVLVQLMPGAFISVLINGELRWSRPKPQRFVVGSDGTLAAAK